MQRKRFILAIAVAFSAQPIMAADIPSEVQREIDRSIAAFPGECPCPYSTDKNGQSCGDKSEYSRPDHKYGYTPFCYPSDVGPLPVAPSASPRILPGMPAPKVNPGNSINSAPPPANGNNGLWI